MEQSSLFGIEGLTEKGWEVPDNVSLEGFLETMVKIQKMENVGPWALGDGMNAGLMRFGDDVWQAIGLHYEEKTVSRIMKVCRDFPISRRAPRVSVWKAEVMRDLPEEVQDHLMVLASEEGITLDEIREQVGNYRGEDQEELGHQSCPWCGSPETAWKKEPSEVEALNE